MKKILATILALVMAIGVTTMAWATETAAEKVAKVGDAEYATLADAVAAADGKTVQLLTNVTASITIENGKTVTLDLNGKTLTNEDGKHTITNNGTLTIVDTSAAKSGKVDNVSHGKGALYNNVGAIATLNGGTFDRSFEKGASANNNGGNSWYTIKNFGTMTVNAGVTVQQDGTANSGTTGKFSSLFANGWQNVSTAPNQNEPAHTADAALTIKGGTFKGGLNTVKNDDCGQLTIEDGTFENYTQACVQNHNVATITGGKYTAEHATYALYNCGCAEGNDIGKLTISGGEFSGDVAIRSVGALDNISISGGTFAGAIVKDEPNSTITVSGGKFTANVSQYLESGKQQNADGSVGNIPRYYYNSTTTTDTKKDDGTKGSPKTFDAGVGIYAVSAVLSVTGMAYVGKKKF